MNIILFQLYFIFKLIERSIFKALHFSNKQAEITTLFIYKEDIDLIYIYANTWTNQAFNDRQVNNIYNNDFIIK